MFSIRGLKILFIYVALLDLWLLAVIQSATGDLNHNKTSGEFEQNKEAILKYISSCIKTAMVRLKIFRKYVV